MKFDFLRFRRCLALASFLFLVPVSAAAQGGSISGHVVLPSGANLNERTKITLQTDRGVRSNVYTDNQGRFQFNGLTPTIYELVVEPDGDRFEIARVTVEVFPNAPSFLNVNLKEKKPSNSNRSATAIVRGHTRESTVSGFSCSAHMHTSPPRISFCWSAVSVVSEGTGSARNICAELFCPSR